MTLMDENETLQELLKPIITMREEWFGYADELAIVYNVQESAQRIDYLLGATLAAYEFVIQKSENETDLDLTEWHRRYKTRDSELISFYGPNMHCWEMNQLIEKLCYESKRSAEQIRYVNIFELMRKQLEMCRMMVNYSIEGDIWSRTFSAALSLEELLGFDEETGGDVCLRFTQRAEWACRGFDNDDPIYEFTYPRFAEIMPGRETEFRLFAIGIDIAMRMDGYLPIVRNEDRYLVAMYHEDLKQVITIRYVTPTGVFYRERGFWWKFLEDAEDFFEDLEMLHVKPEFIDRFDLEEEHRRVTLDELTPYTMSYEEIFPND